MEVFLGFGFKEVKVYFFLYLHQQSEEDETRPSQQWSHTTYVATVDMLVAGMMPISLLLPISLYVCLDIMLL